MKNIRYPELTDQKIIEIFKKIPKKFQTYYTDGYKVHIFEEYFEEDFESNNLDSKNDLHSGYGTFMKSEENSIYVINDENDIRIQFVFGFNANKMRNLSSDDWFTLQLSKPDIILPSFDIIKEIQNIMKDFPFEINRSVFINIEPFIFPVEDQE